MFSAHPSSLSLGPFVGAPPSAEVRVGPEVAGYIASSRDAIGSIGFSGKPIDIWVAIDREARVVGTRLVAHQEPILVIGVTSLDLERYVAGFAGIDLRGRGLALREADPALPAAVSGATVSSAVIKDAVLRTGRAAAAARGLIGGSAGPRIDRAGFRPATWNELVGTHAIASRTLTFADPALGASVSGLARAGRDDLFIELHAALATPPTVGQNLLGARRYNAALAEAGAEDTLILIAGRGLFSFKGTAYRQTGVFDRIELRQGERTFKLTRDSYRNVDALAVADAPELREIALFALPAASGFDPARPWRVSLLIEGWAGGAPSGAAAVELDYVPPASLLVAEPSAEPAGAPGDEPLWLRIWRARTAEIAALAVFLTLLGAVLVFQDALARRIRFYRAFRYGFLVVTLVWLGWIAGAQLSVLNVITFTQSLLAGFAWELFLLDPLIFILWGFVAVGLLFWGRGVFCGWLCPFGALQELLSVVAQRLRVPQLKIPFGVHERLWPIKYIIFLGLFAISLNSVALAYIGAEVEPFKTAITLKFLRPWPFVLYAVLLLAVGLFVQRFFCRYLCPLGAALAIPARLRMFEWLKRRVQCGRECHLCASRCPVQAIHPLGQINPNECIYCLNCQTLYHDETTCPPLMARARRLGRAPAVPPVKEPEHAR